MKIYMNNNVYANKSDIMFILCNKIPAPNSFYNVLYHHTDENGTMEFNNDNKNDNRGGNRGGNRDGQGKPQENHGQTSGGGE